MQTKNLIYPCIALFGVVIIFNTIWKIYPFYGYRILEDWYYINSYQNCVDNNSFITKYYSCKEITKYNFVYPKIWLEISRVLKIYFINFIFFFIICYFFILYYFLKKELSFFFLFIFSPSSLLIIQRANNDLVIFFILFLFGIIIISNKLKKLSFIPLIISIQLKIYPVFLIGLYFLKKVFIKQYIQMLIVLLSIFFFIEEIISISKIYNKSNVTLAYSSDTIFYIINYLVKINPQYIKIISIICMISLIGISFLFKIKIKEKQNSNNEIFFLIGSITLITSFFLSNTYDYKFIFIVFCIPLILELKKNKKKILILILISSWIEFIVYYSRNFSNINNLISYKEILNLNLSSFIFIISTIFKNFIYWVINFYLIILTKDIFFEKTKKIIYRTINL